MARTKGSKNRATVIMEEMIASGIDPAKAKNKSKMQAMREKKATLKASPKKKKSKKKAKKETLLIPEIVAGYNATTRNAWKKAKTGNSRKSSIRAMCLMCVGGSGKEVRECSAAYCPLFKFRITG